MKASIQSFVQRTSFPTSMPPAKTLPLALLLTRVCATSVQALQTSMYFKYTNTNIYFCGILYLRFGAGLVELYKSDAVMEFLGNHVESDKSIYKPGTLRKVCTCMCKYSGMIFTQALFMQLSAKALELGAIEMTIPGRGTILLSQAISTCKLLMMPPSIKLSTPVTSSAAIYGSGGWLINVGDFVLYKSANSSAVRLRVCVCLKDCVKVFTQQEIGLFWGGFRTSESSYCVVQIVVEPDAVIPQLDEFDCPLLTMVDFFRVIPSTSVRTAVSVVHKCSTTCSFVEKTTPAVIEGCDSTVNRLVFVHDWTNTKYCNNIYCIKNNN